MRLAPWTAAAALALVAGLAPATAATAASAVPAASPPARAGTITNDQFRLNALRVLSSSDAWAVGDSPTTLHWDGSSWAPVKIPGSNLGYRLNAADAVSPSDVWAVGERAASPPQPSRTLIVHWDGTAWTRVPSPGPSNLNLIPGLSSVSMDSATDGWAIGSVFNRTTGTATSLLLHWNGTSWQRVTTKYRLIFGVASFSPTDATAVGTIKTGPSTFTGAVFHWDGTSWARTATLHAPPGASATAVEATAVSAASATDMWATGFYSGSGDSGNLAWHWNGTRWAVTTVSGGLALGALRGVAAISRGNVWAVGNTFDSRNHAQTAAVHWDDTSWTQVATPDPGQQDAVLNGVAAAGPGNIWAVGYYTSGPQKSVSHTLILRWNGTSWVRS